MKKLFSIYIIIAVMLPGLTKIGFLIDFKINRDFIAEELCINKNKPITTRNGKCVQSEQIKKANELREKQAPVNIKERIDAVYYHYKIAIDSLHFTGIYVNKLNSTCLDKFQTSSFIANIFLPP